MRIGRAIFVLTCLLMSSSASGKKGKRDGFNFGTSVRVLAGDDRVVGHDDSSSNSSRVESSSQGVSPFVGYAFREFLNLGATFYFEQSKTETSDHNSDGSLETKRTQDSVITGGGLFARFLFANVMFFEGGAGVYEQRNATLSEQRHVNGSSVIGTRTENTTHGIGPGYHFGGGLELPVVNNFYFTATYLARFIQEREYNPSTNAVGRNLATQERRELTFGIIHYYQ